MIWTINTISIPVEPEPEVGVVGDVIAAWVVCVLIRANTIFNRRDKLDVINM